MARLKIDGKVIDNEGFADFVAAITGISGIGKTSVKAVLLYGTGDPKGLNIQKNPKTGEYETSRLPNLLKQFGKDDLVEVEDKGDNPRPRKTTWGAVIEILRANIEAAATQEKLNAYDDALSNKNLVTFLKNETGERKPKVKSLNMDLTQ